MNAANVKERKKALIKMKGKRERVCVQSYNDMHQMLIVCISEMEGRKEGKRYGKKILRKKNGGGRYGDKTKIKT